MPRKSVSYLTQLRCDVSDTATELANTCLDLESLAYSISEMTPEQIRYDKRSEHEKTVKEFKELRRVLDKTLKRHLSSTRLLRSFF